MRRGILSLIYCISIFCSCTNFLSVQPQGEVIPKTDEEFAAIIHTHLKDIEGGGDELIIGNMENIADREGCADDLDANIKVGNQLVSFAGEIINKRQSDYRQTWEVIRDCNIVIENLSDRNSKTALSTLSAAYSIKAICYYNMLRDYCEAWDKDNSKSQLGLPLVDRFDIKAMPARASLSETASYTLSLFDNALKYNQNDKLYIFTEFIIKAYKAKLMFWIEDWDSVISICNDIISNSGYELTDSEEYTSMLNTPGEARGEELLRGHINNSSELDWYFSYIKSYIASRPASAKLIRLYDKENDVRYSTCFDGKRMNVKLAEPRLRLSEIYLMLAEAYYHSGDENMALESINRLIVKRIKDSTGYTSDNLPGLRSDERIKSDCESKAVTPLLQLIFDERRKELYMEGDRWFELKRNGCPEWWVIVNGLKYTTRKYLYTAPIYKGDVDMNPDMIQNEGYTY